MAYLSRKGVTSRAKGDRDVGYEQEYWKFLKTQYEGKLASFAMYDHGKIFANWLSTDFPLWVPFSQMVGECCDFMDPRLKTETIFVV